MDDASSAILDGPSLFQAIATWIALALLTVWVGGLIWETWILNPATTRDADLATATQAAVRRFRALIPTVLGLLVLANVAVVVAQAAASAGDWSGAISPTYLRAILFGSRYGAFWWMRQIVALVALYLTYAATSRGWASARAAKDSALTQEVVTTSDAIPDWRRELVATLRGIGKLPGRLVEGWRARSWFGQIELLLAALLILAFALSGHAAAVSADRFAFAFSVDLLHLLANCAWLGGLFYISLVFVPALATTLATQPRRVARARSARVRRGRHPQRDSARRDRLAQRHRAHDLLQPARDDGLWAHAGHQDPALPADGGHQRVPRLLPAATPGQRAHH